jgi:DNA (cytosine-5)-methyltransferase 1
MKAKAVVKSHHTCPGRQVSAVDLFCGAGGLTYGLKQAGIRVRAGIDLDPACRYPFEHNNRRSRFILADVAKVSGAQIERLFPRTDLSLLAGCAPCQPFSPYCRGTDTSEQEDWGLLYEFARLVRTARPHFVTMENVSDLGTKQVFTDFVSELEDLGYETAWKSLNCATVGVAQERYRLVLLASRIGPIQLPVPRLTAKEFRTVRDVIGCLPRVSSGGTHRDDPMHRARNLDEINLRRIRASLPGGTWRDWPAKLRAPCHLKTSGGTYQSVYARMTWDDPSPTITTQFHNFGTGRFGHPDQNRALTLREAAMLQSFPKTYKFVRAKKDVRFAPLGKLIGNAVPPLLGRAIGLAIVAASKQCRRT